RALALYGDPAYRGDNHMLIAIQGANLSAVDNKFNVAMNGQRIVIEWAFGQITKYYGSLDEPKHQRMLSRCVESHYRFAALFTNIHTCFNGTQLNMHFDIDPPTLQEYIHPQ
ncbi:MAG: hypothetical protein J3R72DRAFT_357285, partial [Linnemannia gamsii]